MQNLPKIIAHRGGRNWAPENTLASFGKSVQFGAAGVEFDVHRCATGELIVIHDDDLKRTTNGVGYIKDISYPEIERLSAGLWFDKEFRSEKVPLLAEVLSLFPENMLINIELKNAPIGYDDIESDLLRELERYPHRDNVVVSSFDHHCLQRLRALDSEIKIGILAAAMLVDLKDYAAKLKAQYYIQAFDCLLPEGAREAKEAGLELFVWTVNEPREWKRCLELGVDAIITDDPEGLRKYLGG
ncbi:MAG: glycerophosphodiester phosphodiesterase [Candidatus Obscuribacterales bacterium]|nr:glycerophosphodiester phosphodiesterase [Candidatus Obscuribacterales bacterium]